MFNVINRVTKEVVYSGETIGHAEIYVNTSAEPWNFIIEETKNEEDYGNN